MHMSIWQTAPRLLWLGLLNISEGLTWHLDIALSHSLRSAAYSLLCHGSLSLNGMSMTSSFST